MVGKGGLPPLLLKNPGGGQAHLPNCEVFLVAVFVGTNNCGPLIN